MDATLTGREQTFSRDEIIVSKTDLKGRILYGNDVFINISGYREDELIGAPHKILRHPHMPKTVFKILWDAIQSRNEIFAYVVNRTKAGDHYWVLAHVTPTLADNGDVIGYHSTRRVPSPQALQVIQPLYKQILDAENTAGSAKAAMEAGAAILNKVVADKAGTYSELIYALEQS